MKTVLALTGNSGVGKDTLAAMLVSDYGYTRLSIGDALRADVRETYGTPSCSDERSKTAYAAGVVSNEAASFKDAMLKLGQRVAPSDPTRYIRLAIDELRGLVGPIVITDLRKPVELKLLTQVPDIALYLVEIRSETRGKLLRLDGLLASSDARTAKYKAVQAHLPNLPEMHGVVTNDGPPEDMLTQLSSIFELTLPYCSLTT